MSEELQRLREELRNRARADVGLSPLAKPKVEPKVEAPVVVEEPEPPKAPEVVESNEERLLKVLSQQHPIHGMVGEAFIRAGGEGFLDEWIAENPGKFLTQMWFKSMPTINPVQGRQGDIVIRIENSLTRTALDEDTIVDVQ